MTSSRDRILIVDDEKDICDILFRLLKKEGYTPLVAHDGETALEMIRLGMPEAVVSDVMMPGMGGMGLLERNQEVRPDFARAHDDRLWRNRRSCRGHQRRSVRLSLQTA